MKLCLSCQQNSVGDGYIGRFNGRTTISAIGRVIAQWPENIYFIHTIRIEKSPLPAKQQCGPKIGHMK